MIGCKNSSTSSGTSNDENNGNLSRDPKTYDLVLSSDGTKIGTISTERILKGDDDYMNADDPADEGFHVTVDISATNFDEPYDIDIPTDYGTCGTFDVHSEKRAAMRCHYDNFLSNPSKLTVIDQDGKGDEAHPDA